MRTIALALTLSFLAGGFAAAAETEKRPKVGLVLGGGGARGAAHIGVLEVLEENHIPIDCIAGTSMGALVAGAYSAGVSPQEMRAFVKKTDWATVFDDSAGRDLVNLRRKELDDRFTSGLEFGVGKDGLKYRSGAIAGEKLKLLFNGLVREDLGSRDIEQLPLPIAIVATDIGTGERVVMRTGNLSSAMRSSMSVPGVLAPVIRDGRKLVDGGLVDNVPIGEVIELCKPDVIIAINVGSPLFKPEEVTGLVSVVGQMVSLLAEQNVAKSLTLMRKQDIYLRPDLGAISSAGFDQQIEAADLGRKAALDVLPVLRTLSMESREFNIWRMGMRQILTPKPPVIDEVRVGETKYVAPESIRAGIRAKEGEALDSDKLVKDLVWVYSQGDLQSLDYSVVREGNKTVLNVLPVEKGWGPNYIRFGVNLATDFQSQADYNVRALYRRTWMNSYGGEWRLGGQIGSEQFITTEFYQPLDYAQHTFVRPFAFFDSRQIGIYNEGDRLADYTFRDSRIGIEGGLNIGIYGQARLGWVHRWLNLGRDTGIEIFPSFKDRVSGPSLNIALDTEDQAYFPTKGFQGRIDYFHALKATGDSGSKYAKLSGAFEGVYSIRDVSLIGEIEGGNATKGNLPAGDLFSLGGPRRLSSFANDQFLGEQYEYGRLEAQWRLTKPIPLLGLNFIAGAIAEAGRMRKSQTELALDGVWLQSYGIYIAANTFLGPVYFGYSDSKKGEGRFYLFVGTP
ncbi:hypothetical protein DSM104443_01047 [Usitatibacter rugosus]|uniref:PNPLA domain-containing protein n=1 Tax=Usitatibacter rugosus TaxID=2732067 RepID=A0A6M4GSC8_9PROT|nr:patatin-like phospholipase family protein [Usitatibacter rugosus]QJR09996.1 hypothetical protein DSM104443_01047 [Usitatibacter rugosus]